MSNFIQVFSGTPVVFSREWTSALAPNNRGGWNFITQGQTTDGTTGSNGIDPLHVDWIVVDLNLETSVVYPMDTRFQYHNDEGSFATHVGFNYQNQKRAPNGKIFFPATPR